MPPFFNKYLGLLQSIENLTIEQFVSELPIETLNITVFPGTTWCNKKRLDTKPFEPLANDLCRELWSVIRTDMLRGTMLDKELGKAVQNIIRLQSPLYDNRQALPAILVYHCQNLYRPPIMGTLCHKIIRPDMVSVGRAKTNT